MTDNIGMSFMSVSVYCVALMRRTRSVCMIDLSRMTHRRDINKMHNGLVIPISYKATLGLDGK